MKKKNTFIKAKILLLIFLSFNCVLSDLHAQQIENLDCGPDPNGIIQNYWDIDTYKPMMDDILLHNSPIKTIDLNFNIFPKPDSTGNFEDTPEDRARLIHILNIINENFSSFGPSDSVPGVDVDELPDYDSRIRFSLGDPGQERIYFYPLYDLYCEAEWGVQKQAIKAEDTNRLNQLNVCFTGAFFGGKVYPSNVHITNGGSGYNSEPEVIFSYGLVTAQADCTIANGSVDSIIVTSSGSYNSCAPEITFNNTNTGGSGAAAYCTLASTVGGNIFPTISTNLSKDISIRNFVNNGNPDADSNRARNITHELGHALDLDHVTSGSACNDDDDYLWDVFGLPNPGNCPHNSNCESGFDEDDDACTNNIMGNNESNYFSPRQAGKMHRSLALLSSRKYVRDDAYIEDAPLVITDNQTWDFNIKLYRDIIIEPGAELTLTCKVVMPWQGSIIVKQNAKLIVDGGTVTCDSKNHFWRGIQVWGTSGVHQYTIEDYCAHGTLILKNGAIVENALIGAYMGGYQENGNGDPAKFGGIIQVISNGSLADPSASFMNNFFSVSFNPYVNYNPNDQTDIKPNRSYFHNALFEANDNYIKDNNWYKTHVRVFGVNGISFKGCTFTNNQTASNLGRGIFCAPGPAKTVNSGFKVAALCTSPMHPCPELSWDKCEFINLAKGIEGFNTELGTFTVEDAIFENNSYGIKMSNVNNASVLFSDFYIGPASSKDKEVCDENSSGYGIFMDNCTGFAIEENYFTKYSGAPAGNYTGLRIDETNATDEIYLNRFDGVSYANYTEGKNWEGFDINMGLEFLCNENQDNYADFIITQNNDLIGGVQSNQGNPVDPAGNEFSPSGANFHILNLGDHNINYYYCGDGSLCPNQIPIYGVNIFNYQASSINQCLSHYGSSGGGGQEEGRTVLDDDEKQEREQQYVQALSDYNNVMDLYESLKDGRNTEVLKTEVETAWPSDMWELRTELLGKSPHLSMEVLKEAADKTDVLPESVLFEILAANPDELKKEELIKYLEDKENPLPQYMVDILRQVAAGTTYKTVLQNQMSGYNQLKTRAAHDMIRSLINDTVTDLASLRNWLDNLGGIRADHQIINTYLAEGDFNSATSLADMLPALYNLSGNDLDEYNYYLDVLNLKIALKQQSRMFTDLTTAELNQLIAIAENSERAGGAEARGILETNYGYDFCDCLKVEDNQGYKSSAVDPSSLSKVYNITINVDPNPAKEWTAFNYSLPDNTTRGVIKIIDITGKVIEIIEVTGLEGQHVWDTRDIKSGVYVYSFIVNGIINTDKIVIQK